MLVQDDSRELEGTKTLQKRDDALDTRPTPAPTGDSSPGTTVHITNEHDFALLLPSVQGGTSDAATAPCCVLTLPRTHI